MSVREARLGGGEIDGWIFFHHCGGGPGRGETDALISHSALFVLAPVRNAAVMMSGLESCTGLLIRWLFQSRASLSQFWTIK